MVKVERNSTVRHSFVASTGNMSDLVQSVITTTLDLHMVLGTYDDEAFTCQNCLDSFKEPITGCKASNENDMLPRES